MPKGSAILGFGAGDTLDLAVRSFARKIGIVMYSDGYADNLLGCTTCETIWIANQEGTILLNNFQ